MQITRFPSLTESQFAGCTAAFVDSLDGELNSALMYLRKLEDGRKGSAFAYEMSLDRRRYGALIVLDRWAELLAAFQPASDLQPVRTSIDVLNGANRVIDAAERYSAEVVESCALAFRSVASAFGRERESARKNAQLGPMLPDDYRQAQRIFMEDLASR